MHLAPSSVPVRRQVTVIIFSFRREPVGGRMHRHDRLDEHLAAVPLFEGLSKKQLRLISQLATELEEPAGTVLIREGKIGHEFIVVVEGRRVLIVAEFGHPSCLPKCANACDGRTGIDGLIHRPAVQRSRLLPRVLVPLLGA